MATRKEIKEQRYAQILMTALDEFIEKGYYGTTTREISKKAGISSGLMFHYFESKEALYDTLLEIGSKEMGLWADKDSERPISVFEDAIKHIFEELVNNPIFAKMFIFMDRAQQIPDATEHSRKLLEPDKVLLQSVPLIQKGQELGQIRAGNPQALAMAFWCAIQGIAQGRAESPEMKMPDTEWILDIIREKK